MTAEERALEAYPDYPSSDGGYITQYKQRIIYKKGYHQAEKDLVLTWEDMKLIQEIQLNVCAKIVRGEKMTEKEQFGEVLKRFNEQKGDKV